MVLNVNNTQFREGIGRASWRRSVSMSAGRCRLLNQLGVTKRSVEASGRRRVVRNALSSPEWGGPKEENHRKEDGNK
jgi:hypothetical protein